jgi:hypothetical protein
MAGGAGEGPRVEGGWPKYEEGLAKGALVVRFSSTDPDSIKREAQRLEKMGLKRGVHFTVKMPENGKMGYVLILKEGLAYAAWLSVHGSKTQRELAEAFIKLILQRAEETDGGKCGKVCEKVKEIVENAPRRWRTLRWRSRQTAKNTR